jgi:hypothetical protein
MGHCSSDDNRASHRPAAQCDRRLLRGRTKSAVLADEQGKRNRLVEILDQL